MHKDSRRVTLGIILVVIALVYAIGVRSTLALASHRTLTEWILHLSATVLSCVAVMALLRENSERRRVERRLLASEERYASLVRDQAAGIASVDSHKVFLFANPAAEEIFGVPPGTLAGRSLLDFVDTDTRNLLMRQMEERRKGQHGTYEHEITRPDGQRAVLVVTAAPRFDESGQFIGTLGMFRDITEQKQAENELRRSRERLAAAQQLARIGYFEVDLRTGENVWTPEMFRIMELEPAAGAMEGYRVLLERADAESRQRIEAGVAAAGERNEPFEHDVRLTFPDGSVRHLHVVGGPILDESGTVVMLRGACLDVTEQKTIEAALHETLAWQKAILDSSGYPIVSTDAQGVIRLFNRAAERMLGYTAAELIGRATPEIFYKPEEVAARAARLSIELGRPVAPGMEALSVMARLGHLDERECTYHRRDGSGVRVQLSVSAMRDDAGAITGFVAIGHDISERDALVREHAQLAAILDTTRDFVSISDGQQHAWFINREGLRMTGLARTAPQEMYDMTLVHPPWAMELIRREALPAAKEKGSWMGETALLDANGREIPVSQLLMAHRDSHGELEFISTVARDISDLKRAEAERERARREAERANAAKSQFLSRMSHELRTPMNAILGFAQLLDMEIEEPKQRRMLGRILRGGGHLLALLDELLDVSRIETGRLCISIEPVDVSEAVTEAVVLIESAAGAGKVTIHATSARRQTRVFADRQRLRQVLLNLLSNAVKYNEPGGRVFVSQEPAGDFVRINVRDTGAGIPEEKLGLLFRYFERLGAEQTAVEGTGIGLALSKRLIEAMAGRIGVSSEPGRGSNFWIELPLVNTGPDEPMLDPRIAIVTAPVQ